MFYCNSHLWEIATKNAGVSREAGDLNFGLSLHLHPYFICATSEGSGSTALCNISSGFLLFVKVPVEVMPVY